MQKVQKYSTRIRKLLRIITRTLDGKCIADDMMVLAVDLGDTSTFTINRKELPITNNSHTAQKEICAKGTHKN